MENILSNKILRINPHALTYYSAPPNWWWFNPLDQKIKIIFIKKFLKKHALYKSFYGGNWDINATYFDETHWFVRIKDFKKNIKKLDSSLWYKLIMKEINSKGFYIHKKTLIRNEKEVINFFENYLMSLIDSLSKNKFVIENEDDMPQVLIGRNGQLIKSAHGCHRLAIIKLFNIKCDFPIKIIGVHKKCELKDKKKLDNFDEIYNYVRLNYSI